MTGKLFLWPLFVFLLFHSSLKGSTGGIDLSPRDSLTHIISDQSSSSEAKFKAAYALVQDHPNSHHDSTLKYATFALDHFPTATEDSFKINLLNSRANILILLGNSDAAFLDLKQAQTMALLQQDSTLLAQTVANIGMANQYAGHIPEAIEFNLRALSLAESIPDSFLLARVCNQLSATYGFLEDLEKAAFYDQKCLQIATAIGDTTNLAFSYNNIAVNNELVGQYDQALFYYLKSFNMTKVIKDSSEWVLSIYNIGSLCGRTEDFAMMKEYMELALTCSKGAFDAEQIALGQLGMAEYYLRAGQFPKAKPYFERALTISQEAENPSLESYIYELLALTGEAGGYYQEALGWSKAENALKDSLNSQTRIARIDELEMEYETQKKDIANARLQLEQANSEVQRQKTLWISILLGSGLVIFLGFMIWNNQRKSQRNKRLMKQAALIQTQNETLQSRNDLLDQLNQEKDALMGIVAHDLKAPLSKAAGLLNILEMRTKEEGLEREVITRMEKVFDQGNSLIDELVLLNELDSQTAMPDLAMVDVKDLVNNSVETFQEVAAQKRIQLQIEAPATGLELKSHAPYLQRILDNLLSNALKFSMPDTQVTVAVRLLDGSCLLEIRDQGPGIPVAEIPELFKKFNRLSNRPTGGESTTGLGLSIVHSLVDRLGGTISVDSKIGSGTSFIASFPKA